MSKIINKILNDITMPVNERTRLVSEWLKTEYRLKEVKDKRFLEQLSEVHDHDNLALHFGEVNVGSAFEQGYVRIVQVNEGWHIAFSRKPGEEYNIIHPSHEQAGVTAENLKTLGIVRNLVKKGTVQGYESVVAAAAPTANGGFMTISGFDEKIVEEGTLDSTPVNYDPLSSIQGNPSIVINMDDYLK